MRSFLCARSSLFERASLVVGSSFHTEMETRVSEVFRVTFEVEVDEAAGGWNSKPIFDAVRGCVSDSTTPPSFRRLTVEKVDA